MDRPVFPEKYEKFWRLFNPDPEFDNRKRATYEQQWIFRSEADQDAMILDLETNGRRKRNPYFYVQEFVAQPSAAPLPPPTNYQHRALPAGKIVVSAKYNGAWGFYTLEDAEAHNMQIRYPDHIFTTDRRIVDQINNHIDWVQVSVPYMSDDFVFSSRANAEKYHLHIIADPRNPDPHGNS